MNVHQYGEKETTVYTPNEIESMLELKRSWSFCH